MASRFLQVLLSATVVAFIAVGCGNRGFNPPSDEDMIHNFYAHEDAFNEITEILLNCPYGDIYPSVLSNRERNGFIVFVKSWQ